MSTSWSDPDEGTRHQIVGDLMRDPALMDRAVPDEPSAILQWPEPLAAEAFHGLAGDIVRTIEPHSEADPAALLLQFLVAFGNIIGRGPHFTAEADRHGANLFVALVGPTAKGRKGASWGQVKRVFAAIDEEWLANNVKSGLSSGEGLIWHIRDEIREPQPVKEKRIVKGFEVITTDPGVSDKRLLIVEPEFGRVLQSCERQSNTLSAIIRQAWDGDKLAILTKKQAATATEPHISIIAHITSGELRRLLTDTQAGNGFGNRFLWLCVKRSKLLPNGGSLHPGEIEALSARLDAAVRHARQAGEIRRDKTAGEIWEQVYGPLSEGRPGLVGSLTSRSEAQVMRLAGIYAQLDRCDEIEVHHLAAGLAVWRYCEASAVFIFGDSLGDATADELLAALRSSSMGLTRTDIRDLFGRNRNADQIDRALSVLAAHGLARRDMQQNPKGGRPAERWFSITATTKTILTTKPQG